MEIEHTAIHEAGHAVAHSRLNVLQMSATIKQHDDMIGSVLAEGKDNVYRSKEAEEQVLCYCAGYAALIAAGYGDQEASSGADDDFETAAELIANWLLSGTLDEWKSRSVELMSTPENIRAVEFVAKALVDYETLDFDYMGVLIDRADGDTSEEEWHQFVSWQYPEMV